ncbi:MAG: hypothetical protein H0X63_12965 [Flavobacteriales bacterium]|jgi:hypothetical protein|nr:hypothetical protein [Flavobacteriales bacterium]
MMVGSSNECNCSEAYWNENYREDFINYYSNLNAQEKIDYFNALAQGRQAFLGGAYDLTAHLLSTIGDATTLVGYGLTLTVVGAPIGVPLMTIGKGISMTGSGMSAMSSFSQGNYGDLAIHGGSIILGRSASKLISNSGMSSFSQNLLDRNTSLKISGVVRLIDFQKSN